MSTSRFREIEIFRGEVQWATRNLQGSPAQQRRSSRFQDEGRELAAISRYSKQDISSLARLSQATITELKKRAGRIGISPRGALAFQNSVVEIQPLKTRQIGGGLGFRSRRAIHILYRKLLIEI